MAFFKMLNYSNTSNTCGPSISESLPSSHSLIKSKTLLPCVWLTPDGESIDFTHILFCYIVVKAGTGYNKRKMHLRTALGLPCNGCANLLLDFMTNLAVEGISWSFDVLP